jgi:hypothetical protein
MLLRRLYCVLYIVSAVHISYVYQQNTACTKLTVLRTAHYLVVHILYAYQRNISYAAAPAVRSTVLYCVLYIVSAVHISYVYQQNTACTKLTVLHTAHYLVVHILYAYQRNTACAKLTVLRTVLHIILDTHSVYIYISTKH